MTGVAIGSVWSGHRRRRYSTFPPPRTHAPVTNTRLGQTRDRCTRRLFSGERAGVRGANVGHVMLTGGRGLWTTARAAVGLQCWANHVVLCTSMMLVIINDAVDRVTVTQFCFISKPAVFAAILWVKCREMFVTVILLKYALLVR